MLAKVKRALRRDMRKPSDVKVRQCYQHLARVNNEEITGLPPAFSETQKPSDEEMTDIILFGAPRTWQNKMNRQGFDPKELIEGIPEPLWVTLNWRVDQPFDGVRWQLISS